MSLQIHRDIPLIFSNADIDDFHLDVTVINSNTKEITYGREIARLHGSVQIPFSFTLAFYFIIKFMGYYLWFIGAKIHIFSLNEHELPKCITNFQE